MKILMIILNLLAVAWLLLVTPVVDAAAAKHATRGVQELMKNGAVEHDALLALQKMNQNEFRGSGIQFVGPWLTRKQTHAQLLILPAGILLLLNCLAFAVELQRKRKPRVEQPSRPVPK